MRHFFIVTSVLMLGGCNRMLGLEEDYVLREPLKVRVEGGSESVTLPAGTRVKQKSFKDIVSFIVVHGRANRAELERVGEPQ